MNVVFTIDPSGSGTTGICVYFYHDNSFEFLTFKSKNWQEHFLFILESINQYKVEITIYETTNFIQGRTQHSLNLLKLIGAISTLPYCCNSIKKIESVAVNQVKLKKKKIQKKEVIIKELNLQVGRGKGWNFQNKKINLHQLDALIIFFIWKEKNGNPKNLLYLL